MKPETLKILRQLGTLTIEQLDALERLDVLSNPELVTLESELREIGLEQVDVADQNPDTP